MKAVLTSVVFLVFAVSAAAETWTNRSGRVFSARLVSVGDAGAVFRYAEDGATETLPLAKLSPACARRASARFGFAPIPPRLASTYNRAAEDLRRVAASREDGLLTAERAEKRRAAVLGVFAAVCREKGLSSDETARLVARLAKETFPAASPD